MVTRKRGVHKTECSRCGGPLEKHRIGKQAYCLECHAKHMRDTRPKHSDLPDEAKLKATTRAYTHVYIKRGKIIKESCAVCGSSESEAHHNDYLKPLDVRWLCRPHHLEWHRTMDGKDI
jgi:ribosomal protein S27AE